MRFVLLILALTGAVISCSVVEYRTNEACNIKEWRLMEMAILSSAICDDDDDGEQ